MSDFNNAYIQGDYKKTVYDYIRAEDYYYKVKAVGVNLDFPEKNKEYYQEAKDDYLKLRYAEGIEKLNREDFEAARKVFEEIISIDPNFKDAKDQFNVAKYEPMYREAIQWLENDLYRKAYYQFETILAGTGQYKQALFLKDEAQEKATLHILVSQFFTESRRYSDVSSSITNKVKGNLSNTNNPFLKIIDRQTLDVDLYKNGKLDMQAANLAGIDAILMGKVEKVAEVNGDLNKKVQKGYLKETRTVKNEAGEEVEKVYYNKTTYAEYNIQNEAELDVSFQLVSTVNNEIMVSDMLTNEKSDRAHYAVFDGDKKKLVPGYYKSKTSNSSEDLVKDNTRDVRNLRDLLDSKRTPRSAVYLLGDLVSQCADRMTSKIEYFNPEE